MVVLSPPPILNYEIFLSVRFSLRFLYNFDLPIDKFNPELLPLDYYFSFNSVGYGEHKQLLSFSIILLSSSYYLFNWLELLGEWIQSLEWIFKENTLSLLLLK